MVRLTALVCAQNQEAQLSRCLRRLSFCDEIVVVADRCTDGSQEIARRQGAILVDGIFPLQNQRKAAGLAACTGDWILELEADEEVDPALAWEIRAVLKRPTGAAYVIPIHNYVGDAPVRGGWTGDLSSDRAVRLYRRGLKAWRPRRLDEGAAAPGAEVGALTGALRRHLGDDLGGLLERLRRISGMAAEDLADGGQPPRAGAGAAAAGFLRSYLLRGGWREGRLGLVVAALTSLYPILASLRARELIAAREAALRPAAQPAWPGKVVGLNR